MAASADVSALAVPRRRRARPGLFTSEAETTTRTMGRGETAPPQRTPELRRVPSAEVAGPRARSADDAVLLTLLAQSLDVGSPVFVNQEDVLAIVAPLGDVVRNALHDHTRHSWHRRVLPV